MAVEIERKFLVIGQPWKTWKAGVYYQQGYLSKDIHATTRVRLAGDKGYLTVKGKTDGISRLEFEYNIPQQDAQQLLSLCTGIIEKTRYLYEHQGHVWELDVFHGDNQGLVVAEIELKNIDEAFAKPSWIGLEVSNDVRYFNSSLSSTPWASWVK